MEPKTAEQKGEKVGRLEGVLTSFLLTTGATRQWTVLTIERAGT